MKVLLIQPPIEDFYDTDIRLQPLGISYLKAILNRDHPDVEVVIRDYHHNHGRQTTKIPKELQYLREYYAHPDSSPFCTFHNYYHFGASWEFIENDIRSLAPDLVGISSLFSPYFKEVLKVASIVKSVSPSVEVVLGGSHASAMPEFMMKSPFVDYILQGEGERPLRELVEYKKGKRTLSSVSNLFYRRQNQIVSNTHQDNDDIESLPFPDLSWTRPADYTYQGRSLTFILTSRSCPYRCHFCSVHATFGTTYRVRSIESVIEEIKIRYQQGYRVFDFEDDNLSFNQSRMKKLCLELKQNFEAADVEFFAMNGISYQNLNEELLRLMKEAKFSQVNISLVTSNNELRSQMNRPHNLDHYKKIVHQATSLGLKVISYQILGLPGETLESMIETLVTNAQLPVLLGASPFYLAPGSELAKKNPHQSEEEVVRSRLTALNVNPLLNRDQLYTLFILTRMINFLKEENHEGDRRSKIGFTQLEELRSKRTLSFYSKAGKMLNNRFDADLALQILEKLDFISLLNGHNLNMNESNKNHL